LEAVDLTTLASTAPHIHYFLGQDAQRAGRSVAEFLGNPQQYFPDLKGRCEAVVRRHEGQAMRELLRAAQAVPQGEEREKMAKYQVAAR
jgi:hypothetical protein